MSSLPLHNDQELFSLAANIRNALSGIVAGNVKEQGIRAVELNGPLKLNGSKKVMQPMASLLDSFVKMQRMKIPGSEYRPCYEINYSD